MREGTGRFRKVAAAAITAAATVAGFLPVAALAPHAASAKAGFTLTRIAGNDRYETAAAIATHDPFDKSDTVVVASGEKFPDALTGNYPAGVEGAPLVLTRLNDVPQVTLDAIKTLGATN